MSENVQVLDPPAANVANSTMPEGPQTAEGAIEETPPVGEGGNTSESLERVHLDEVETRSREVDIQLSRIGQWRLALTEQATALQGLVKENLKISANALSSVGDVLERIVTVVGEMLTKVADLETYDEVARKRYFESNDFKLQFTVVAEVKGWDIDNPAPETVDEINAWKEFNYQKHCKDPNKGNLDTVPKDLRVGYTSIHLVDEGVIKQAPRRITPPAGTSSATPQSSAPANGRTTPTGRASTLPEGITDRQSAPLLDRLTNTVTAQKYQGLWKVYYAEHMTEWGEDQPPSKSNFYEPSMKEWKDRHGMGGRTGTTVLHQWAAAQSLPDNTPRFAIGKKDESNQFHSLEYLTMHNGVPSWVGLDMAFHQNAS